MSTNKEILKVLAETGLMAKLDKKRNSKKFLKWRKRMIERGNLYGTGFTRRGLPRIRRRKKKKRNYDINEYGSELSLSTMDYGKYTIKSSVENSTISIPSVTSNKQPPRILTMSLRNELELPFSAGFIEPTEDTSMLDESEIQHKRVMRTLPLHKQLTMSKSQPLTQRKTTRREHDNLYRCSTRTLHLPKMPHLHSTVHVMGSGKDYTSSSSPTNNNVPYEYSMLLHDTNSRNYDGNAGNQPPWYYGYNNKPIYDNQTKERIERMKKKTTRVENKKRRIHSPTKVKNYKKIKPLIKYSGHQTFLVSTLSPYLNEDDDDGNDDNDDDDTFDDTGDNWNLGSSMENSSFERNLYSPIKLKDDSLESSGNELELSNSLNQTDIKYSTHQSEDKMIIDGKISEKKDEPQKLSATAPAKTSSSIELQTRPSSYALGSYEVKLYRQSQQSISLPFASWMDEEDTFTSFNLDSIPLLPGFDTRRENKLDLSSSMELNKSIQNNYLRLKKKELYFYYDVKWRESVSLYRTIWKIHASHRTGKSFLHAFSQLRNAFYEHIYHSNKSKLDEMNIYLISRDEFFHTLNSFYGLSKRKANLLFTSYNHYKSESIYYVHLLACLYILENPRISAREKLIGLWDLYMENGGEEIAPIELIEIIFRTCCGNKNDEKQILLILKNQIRRVCYRRSILKQSSNYLNSDNNSNEPKKSSLNNFRTYNICDQSFDRSDFVYIIDQCEDITNLWQEQRSNRLSQVLNVQIY